MTLQLAGAARRRSEEIGSKAFARRPQLNARSFGRQDLIMNLFRQFLAISLLVSSPGDSTGTSTEAVTVALRWLEALRTGDEPALASLSGYPLRIEGLNIDSGPDAIACGNKPRSDELVGVRSFDPRGGFTLDIPERAKFREKAVCLFKDTMLRDYIPVLHDGRWPQDRKRALDGNVGTISAVEANQISSRLRRYRKQIRLLANSHSLVQARMTDNNGVTNTVLLALHTDVAGKQKVFSVLVDELFED